MKTKKSNKSNIEKLRGMYFQLGLCVVMALCLLAFEWGTNLKDNKNVFTSESYAEEEELAPIIRFETPKPPPPPAAPIELLVIEDIETDIEEVDIEWTNDVNIDDSFNDKFTLEDEKAVDDGLDKIFNSALVEKMPTFKGGDCIKFQQYVQKNLSYNNEAIELGLQGKVTVQFVIDKNGNLSEAKIIRGVDPLLDNEVIKVLKRSPKWKPGTQRGIPVNVSFIIPVFFKLS